MLKSIKIGRKEYPLKKGDYIIGSKDKYSLYAGDNRTLRSERFTRFPNISLTKKAVKELKLETLRKKEIYDDFYQKSFTYWFLE